MAEDDYPRSRSGAGADNGDVEDGGGGGGEGDTTLTAGARHGFLLGGVDGVNGAGGVEGEMTDLERLVLAEYERLRGNMRRLNDTLTAITTTAAAAAAGPPSTAPPPRQTSTSIHSQPRDPRQQQAVVLSIADGLRQLERKVASVYTLLKASVYSIVLSQGAEMEDGGDARGEGRGEEG